MALAISMPVAVVRQVEAATGQGGPAPVAVASLQHDSDLGLAPQQFLEDRHDVAELGAHHQHRGFLPALAGSAGGADAVGDAPLVGVLDPEIAVAPGTDPDHPDLPASILSQPDVASQGYMLGPRGGIHERGASQRPGDV